MRSNLKKKQKKIKYILSKPKNTKNMKTLKNIQHEPNNIDFKSHQIWINQGHKYVENHARINNLAFMHLGYHSKTTILSN